MESNDNTATNTTNEDGGVGAPVAAQEATADSKTADADLSLDDYKQALADANRQAARYRVERNEVRDDALKYRELQEAEKTDLQHVQRYRR